MVSSHLEAGFLGGTETLELPVQTGVRHCETVNEHLSGHQRLDILINLLTLEDADPKKGHNTSWPSDFSENGYSNQDINWAFTQNNGNTIS